MEILKRLEENDLFFKLEKCIWKVKKVGVLGVVIRPEGVKIEEEKVKGIVIWVRDHHNDPESGCLYRLGPIDDSRAQLSIETWAGPLGCLYRLGPRSSMEMGRCEHSRLFSYKNVEFDWKEIYSK